MNAQLSPPRAQAIIELNSIVQKGAFMTGRHCPKLPFVHRAANGRHKRHCRASGLVHEPLLTDTMTILILVLQCSQQRGLRRHLSILYPFSDVQ